MSSAFLDTGAPIQNPDPNGQFSHPLISSFIESYLNSNPGAEPTQLPKNRLSDPMKPSSFGDSNSGFSGSSARGANVSFTSPSVSRTSGRGLSRPRFVKVRKQSGSQIPKPATETGEVPGFNPFRHVLGRVEPVSSGNEAFMFEANRSDLGDKRVVEGIRNLRIGCENDVLDSNSNVSDMTGFVFGRDCSKSSVMDVKLEKLSIDDSGQFADGRSKLSANSEVNFGLRSGGNVDDTATGRSADSGLSYELKKKLNVATNGDSDNGSGGRVTFGASDRKMFGLKSDEIGRDMFVKTSENLLPDQIKNLNINDQVDANNAGTRTSEKDSDVYGSRERAMGYGSGERETLQSNKMGCNINLESVAREPSCHAGAMFSSSQISEKDLQTGKKGDMKFPVCAEGFPAEFIFKGGLQGNNTSGSQVPIGQHKVDTQTDLSSGGLAGGTAFGVPSTQRPEMPDMFIFTSKQENVKSPFVEFKTPNQWGSLFSSQKPEFGAKLKGSKVKKEKGKLKQPTKVHLCPGHDFVSNASCFQHVPQVLESYSPMDISPYQVIASESDISRETSVTSEELFSHDNQYASAGSQQTVMSDAIDEDLAAMTQHMTINGEDVLCGETEHDSSKHFSDKVTGVESYPEQSISGAETESFKSASEELDSISEGAVTSAENEASLSTNIERQDRGIWTQFGSAASSEFIGGSGFTFAASSSGQALPKRYQKKKDSRAKAVHDSYHFTKDTQFQDVSSSLQFSPLPTSSLPLAPEDGKKVANSLGTVGDNYEVHGQESRQESFSTTAASTAAQEACEKWRLRGNQAYKNGDLSKAEECYTQGLNCVSRSETSRSCLRALMLCYSNRAATRMSLGRMRDALEDCQAAADIDPNFLRVQVRAANCHLALGEVEHALQYFNKCLQLGTDVCVDRKIAVEASEGLQKAQKFSKLMQHSAELLQRKTSDDAVRALEVIVEALSISSYSEKLLEMKAKSLFMLRKYEDVIQLCEQTLDLAKKNSPSARANCQLPDMDDSALTENSSFLLWRCCLIVKSYFYLGKLEEAISSLEKHDKLTTKSWPKTVSKTLESSIPLAPTVRALLQHKVLFFLKF
uniref:Uncharacterized protein n=1 Tax=Rhizophora mucronata TaxID=61149 RepID=A0A2P2K760_RHIMU